MPRSRTRLEDKQRCMRARNASGCPVSYSDNSEASSLASSFGERPRIDVDKPPPSLAPAQTKRRRGDVSLDLRNLSVPENVLLSLVDDWIVRALVEQFLREEMGVGERSDQEHN